MAENVVINFQADTTALKSAIDLLEAMGQVDKKTAEEFRRSTKAYEERLKALKESSNAGKNFGSDIETGSKKATKAVRESADQFGFLKDKIVEVGAAIGIAFGVSEIVNFYKESVNAFAKAEAQTNKLKFALENITKEGGAFSELVKQSSELAKATFFDDEDIQSAQAMQAQFGLTSAQIKKLTPLIIELAAAQGTDLATATDIALRAIEGQTRGLKTVGAAFDDTKNPVENYNLLISNLAKLEGSASDALNTTEGQLKRNAVEFENLQEKVGKFNRLLLALKETAISVGADLADLFFPSSTKEKLRTDIDAVKKIISIDPKATVESLRKEAEDIGKQMENIKKQGEALPFNFDRGEKLDELREKYHRLLIQQLALREAALDKLNADKKAADESERATTLEVYQKEQLLKLSKQQLESEIAILSKRADANTTNVKFEIDRRKEAVQIILDNEKKLQDQLVSARKDASEKLKQLTIQDQRDLLVQLETSNAAKLEREKANLIEERKQLYEVGLKTKEDKERLEIDIEAITNKYNSKISQARIDAEEELIKKINEMNRKAREDQFNAQIAAIDEQANKEEKVILDNYNTKKDFSQKAQEDLQKALDQIELGAQIRRNNAILASDKFSNAEKAKAAKENAELVAGYHSDAANKDIELEATKQSIIRQIQDTALAGTFDIFKQQTENLIAALEEQKQIQLDHFDELTRANQEQFDNRAISAKEFHATEKKLADQRVATERNAQNQIKELKRKEDIANRLQKLFEITIATARNIAETKNPLLIPYYVALGAVQAGIVLSTPLPKYAKGTLSLGRGTSPAGTDTIPILANEGEAITPTQEARDYHTTLKAIHGRKVPAIALNEFVKNFTVKDMKSPSYVSNTTMEIDYEKLASEIAWAMRSDGRVKVTNWDGLAQVLGSGQDLRRIRN